MSLFILMGGKYYEVEEIQGLKETSDGKVKYFIKWKGYPSSENTWEEGSNLNCPDLVEKFYQENMLKNGHVWIHKNEDIKKRSQAKIKILKMKMDGENIEFLVLINGKKKLIQRKEMIENYFDQMMDYYESKIEFKDQLNKK